MNYALGYGRYDDEPDFLQGVSRCGQHLPQLGRHVARWHLLLPRRRDDIACGQGTLKENPLQRFGMPLKPQIILCRREHDTLGRARLQLVDMDEIAGADTGIGPLQPVQAQHVQPFIFLIGAHYPRSGRSLANDLDHIAFSQAQLRHNRQWQPRQPASGIFGPRIGNLNPPSRHVIFRHCGPLLVAQSRNRKRRGQGKGAGGEALRTKKGPAQRPARKVLGEDA